jgi:diketogulonate reductase-like aldo/keto reductase
MTSPFYWRLPRLNLPQTRYVWSSHTIWSVLAADMTDRTHRRSQILLHPYVYARQAPLLAYHGAEGIVTEAYSALTYVPSTVSSLPLFGVRYLASDNGSCWTNHNSPITHQPGGPVDKPVNEIAQRLNATADQVLLAWVKAKGAVAVTYDTPYFSTLSGPLTGFCLSIL